MGFRLAVLVLILLTFGARVYRLEFQPLWFDEGYTLFFATLPGASVSAGGAEPHPPLYFLLFKLWAAGAGFGDFGARYLSVIFATLQLPLAWALGRRLTGNAAAGVFAALAVGLNPFLWSHGREARMYSLVPALALAFSLAAVRAWSDPAPRANRLFLGLSLLAGLYSHYFFGLLALGPALGLLAFRPALRPVILAAGLLYLPWVVWAGPDLLRGAGSRGESYQPLAAPDYLLGYLQTVAGGEGCGAGCPPGTFGAAMVGGALGLALVRVRRCPGAGLLWVGLVSALAFGFGLQLRYPFGGYVRLQSATVPVMLSLAVAGLTTLVPARRWPAALLPAAFAVALAVAGIPGVVREYRENLRPLEDYRPLARWLATSAWSDDLVLCDFPWQVGYFLAYLPEPRPKLLYPPNPFAGDPPFRRKTEVWYPAYQALGGTAGGRLETLLRSRLVLAENRWFGNTRLLRFAPNPTQTRWGRSERLTPAPRPVTWSLPAAPVDAGRTVVVGVEWNLGDLPRPGLKTFVHLATADEAIVAQADVALEEYPGPQLRVGLPIPPGTPAGEYRVWAGLYRADTGERLPPGPDATPDRRMLLGTVTVGRPEILPRPDVLPRAAGRNGGSLGPYQVLGVEAVNITGPRTEGTLRPGDILELRIYLGGRSFSGTLELRAEVDGLSFDLGRASLDGCYPPYCRLPLRVVVPPEATGPDLRLTGRLDAGAGEAELGRWTLHR